MISNPTFSHLWLAWRTHRTAWVGSAIASLLCAAATALAVDEFALPRQPAPVFATLLALAITVFTLGSEVVGRELGAGARPFLARLPCGALRPFAIRLALYSLTLVALAAAAYGTCAALLDAQLEVAVPYDTMLGYAPHFATATLAAGFSLLASCWLSQSLLAAPAGIVAFLALVGFPLAATVNDVRIADVLATELPWLLAAVLAATLAASFASFRAGIGHGSRGAALRTGLVVLSCGLVPVYGIAAHRVSAHFDLDPGDPRFAISGAWIGAGGNFAFVSAYRAGEGGPSFAYAVDLRSGSHRRLGVALHVLPAPTDPVATSRRDGEHDRFITVRDRAPVSETARFLDGRTGEWIADAATPSCDPASIVRRAAELSSWPRPEFQVTERVAKGEESIVPVAQTSDEILVQSWIGVDPSGIARYRLERISRSTGERAPLSLASGAPALLRGHASPVAATPSGAPVLGYHDGEAARCARYDAARGILVPTPPGVIGVLIVACRDEDEFLALAADSRRIVRGRFGGESLETVFPRPAP
jgi:hypothetical protein